MFTDETSEYLEDAVCDICGHENHRSFCGWPILSEASGKEVPCGCLGDTASE